MKKNLFKTQIILLVIFSFITTIVNGQVGSLAPGSTTASDPNRGPTLVICSNVTVGEAGASYEFFCSQTRLFNIAGNYEMVKIDPNLPNSSTNFQYLNEAINFYLQWRYRKIIILAGRYKTNGSIVLDTWSPGNSLTTGGITIEGEGNSTIIENTTATPVFVVRSNYNTVKNLRIAINDNFPTVGIKLGQETTAALAKTENNVFENIYIGHKNYASTPRTNTGFVGIELLQTEHSNIGYNKFKNISLQSLYTGIKFSTDGITQSWDHDGNPSTPDIVTLKNNINDNVFENISMKAINTGIDFVPNPTTNPTFYPQADYNSFDGVHIQTATNTVYFVNNVSGSMNYFNDFKAADWGSSAGNALITDRKIFVITNSATQTTITNSRLASTEVRASTNDITDNGFNTQLLNNYNSSGTMINKIGIDKVATNPYRNDDRGLTEIKGRLKLSANDASFNNTFGANKVLTSDASGFATWQTLGSLAWNHIATKNIKMDGFALTNHDNATDNTNTIPGLRLDNNGNVRIGTTAPDATNPAKLQVDGRAIIGDANDEVNGIAPEYKLIVNGKVRVRNEVYVKQDGLTWPDYVFANNYKLMPLQEVEKHINENGHLPNMPSATEVEKDGIAVGDLIKRQQEKIEEFTLYLIEMKKEIEALKSNQKN